MNWFKEIITDRFPLADDFGGDIPPSTPISIDGSENDPSIKDILRQLKPR